MIQKSSKPRLALVHDIHDKSNKAVVAELTELLGMALSGKIIGLAYACQNKNLKVEGGAAGTFYEDKWKATGALFGIAMSAAQEDQ